MRNSILALSLLLAAPAFAQAASDQFTYVPTVSSLSPNSGPAAGGTVVTITGSGFSAPAVVNFGTAPATNVTVVSSTQITATSPPGAVGTVSVTVIVNGISSIP